MQMQTDLLGVPVVRPKVNETTALGAACLAGLATGFWKNLAEIAKHWKADQKFTPKLKANPRKAKTTTWQRALARSKAWEQP
jgi:glycerol kinase